MKKRSILLALLMIAALLVFAACGSSGGDTADSQDAGGEAEAEQAEDAGSAVHPYAWLGLQDMPECSFLDTLATYHYYETYDSYTMSVKSEITEAADGINTFTDNAGTKTYSIDGMITSVNDNSKIYMEYDMTDVAADEKARLEEARANGTNIFGREFVETGKDSIPEYKDSGDTAEYEYYEYNYPEVEASGTTVTERFYMKDGDVFAIYTKTVSGDSELEVTKVIKSMSGDIPAGTFDLPDLSDYSKYES